MIITNCSHCDYTLCRCTPDAIERRRREDHVWIPYAEYKAHERLYQEREQELLRSWGLGWMIEFCSKSNKDNGELDR